ncbi:MAG: SUF system NifU family Fe-S cluster assembly protein [Candidatus Sumerlaeales bacterium]|nr:SUF system NifU family Fe-S cluster assembly protein [Candidatus Sumerlaeales bacterium]
MTEQRDLYQEIILDHNRNPKNCGALDHCTHSANGYNPLCGDKLQVQLVIKDNVIEDIKFHGNGCAISVASASMMTQVVKGKTVEECMSLFGDFREMVTGNVCPMETAKKLGKLSVFSGVKDYPTRIKCAILCWHTLKAALHGEEDDITTEDE